MLVVAVIIAVSSSEVVDNHEDGIVLPLRDMVNLLGSMQVMVGRVEGKKVTIAVNVLAGIEIESTIKGVPIID